MATRRSHASPSDGDEPPPDVKTVIEAQAGDEQAFERLYLCYFRRIAAFLIHLVGNEETGHDLAMNTFTQAWKSLGQLQRPEAFVKWLYQIARNLAHDTHRQKKRVSFVSLAQEHEQIEDTRSCRPDEQIIAQDRIRCALAALSHEDYRLAVILYHIEGMSKGHIAQVLNLQESSVQTYISLGMSELRAYLQQTE